MKIHAVSPHFVESKPYKQTMTTISYTVKPVYNDHPWDPKIVAVVDTWLLFRDYLSSIRSKCAGVTFQIICQFSASIKTTIYA